MRGLGWLSFAVATGCMLSPIDGENVGDSQQSVTFEGFTGSASADVEVRGLVDSTWTLIAPAQSGDVGYTVDGFTGYYWSVDAVILDSMWECTGVGQAEAQVEVRGAGGGSALNILVEDGSTCYAATTGWLDFANQCTKSPPVAVLEADRSTCVTVGCDGPPPFTGCDNDPCDSDEKCCQVKKHNQNFTCIPDTGFCNQCIAQGCSDLDIVGTNGEGQCTQAERPEPVQVNPGILCVPDGNGGFNFCP